MNFKLTATLFLSFLIATSCKEVNKNPETSAAESTATSSEQSNASEEQNTEVAFYAGGNEPAWNVQFKEGRMHFSAPDAVLKSFVAPIPEPEVSGNTSKYIAKSQRVLMEVVMVEEECIDTMSGEKNSRKVTVSIKPIAEKDFRVFEGCGSFNNNKKT